MTDLAVAGCTTPRCAACFHTLGAGAGTCACGLPSYCGAACQRGAWAAHRGVHRASEAAPPAPLVLADPAFPPVDTDACCEICEREAREREAKAKLRVR